LISAENSSAEKSDRKYELENAASTISTVEKVSVSDFPRCWLVC